MATTFESVRKRNGNLEPFDQSRITNAIGKALAATQEGDTEKAEKISNKVIQVLSKRYSDQKIVSIEDIQDVVEEGLILSDYPKTAKAYILYRQGRAELRKKRKTIPDHVQKLVKESRQYFRNPLAEFIYYRSYSRWIEAEDRRETWIETVGRYMDFMKEGVGDKLSDAEYSELREAILKHEVMPSMRLMWSAGKAARSTNVAGYNCSFIAPSKLQDFGEVMYLSMCGTGVGFSVEQQTVQMLPQIKMQVSRQKTLPMHIVDDSREGWADAFVVGLKTWFGGKDIQFDYSKLRPVGARLNTMGGRSSGPGPLRELIDFSRRKVLAKQGRRLDPIDVHDIVCKIGEVVVSGGVRRSALISLSDLDDQKMRLAKSGQFYINEPQRSMANNSVAYTKKPSATEFFDEWIALAKNGTGERGIFNRGDLQNQVPERRWKVLAKDAATTGTNPCGEIILKSKEFCNLTEVVARAEDTEESLLKKIRLATILGTYQSTLTDFPYLSKDWKKNCEQERLLGVSITGQWDCPAVREAESMTKLRAEAVKTNELYAKKLGVNPSTSVTCVKPSGTVSQLVDAASGLHPRHSKYYIRRVRISATDSLFKMLKDQKVPYYPEVGQKEGEATTYVLEFPVKAPEGAILRNDIGALDHMEYWKLVKENYTEHNPSVTISVGDAEWVKVANWLYEYWPMVGGLSFLPRSEHVYALAPYEEISEEKYGEMMEQYPKVDFSQIVIYEKEDETQGSKELACVGGVCEILQ
ncbi:MAG: ATP cone domain-containing protein [bacterium]|nr:ATP cone domain-containing protein [bacterium]